LFGNLSGAPVQNIFSYTFSGCSGLTGSIPAGLFGNLSGAPGYAMFAYTFQGCSGLTGSIPVGLFGNLSNSTATSMFTGTFYNCTGLTGESALMPDGVTHLYEFFANPGFTSTSYSGPYTNATGLSDYANIPILWK